MIISNQKRCKTKMPMHFKVNSYCFSFVLSMENHIVLQFENEEGETVERAVIFDFDIIDAAAGPWIGSSSLSISSLNLQLMRSEDPDLDCNCSKGLMAL